MIAHLGTNRIGQWCCCYPDDCKDAYPTRELAEQAVRRANAEIRVQAKREAQHQARMSLAALSQRLRVGLHLLPDISPSSTSIAKPAESAVCA